jgi:hypothetical protein
MKWNTENRSWHFLYPACNQYCERWRGTRNETGRVCRALLGGLIPSRASIQSHADMANWAHAAATNGFEVASLNAMLQQSSTQ